MLRFWTAAAQFWKPQTASNAETTRPTQDTDIGTDMGPTWTFHRRNNLTKCPAATIAKINAEIVV